MSLNPPFTILMADDDREDIEIMEEAIKDQNGDVHFHKVFNGKAVLEYLHSKSQDQLPCLIVLDYNMPELNGSQVLFELNKNNRYHKIKKVIFSTANAPMHMKECRDNGADEYLVKPTNMSDLQQIAQKLLTYCVS